MGIANRQPNFSYAFKGSKFGRILVSFTTVLLGFGLVILPVTTTASASTKNQGDCVSANGVRIKHNPLLCKGLQFYKGQTINFIISASVGGAADTPIRQLIPFLSEYLGATINPVNLSNANGVQGMDAGAAAVPNGLTIFSTNVATNLDFLINGAAGLNFNMDRVAWLFENDSTTNTIIASSTSPYTSIAALEHATSPVTVITNSTGIAPLQMALLFGLLKIPVHYIASYASNTALVAGFARGDGPVTSMNLTTAGPFAVGKKAIPLAVSFKIPPSTEFRSAFDSAPTMTQLLNGIKTKNKIVNKTIAAFKALLGMSNTPICTQTGVASYKVAALKAAGAWIATQQTLKQNLLNVSANPNFESASSAKQQYAEIVKDLPLFKPYFTAF